MGFRAQGLGSLGFRVLGFSKRFSRDHWAGTVGSEILKAFGWFLVRAAFC